MISENELQKQWLLRDKYSGNVYEGAIADDLERLEKGEPIDYVIGWRSFLGTKIDLSYKPLIPREATEFWVERAISEIKSANRRKELHILDLFAGSGAIGIALLKHLPNIRVDFGEINARLISQIKHNLSLNNIAESQSLAIETDVFGNLSGRYDFIFANPPYLGTKCVEHIQKSVLDFEPHQALFGGEDGMYFLEKFLTEAKRFLLPGGTIYFEFHSPQKEKLEELCGGLGYRFSLCKDQLDLYRWGRVSL